MPWVVGVDEAGYGPNLGPLAQAAVAVRLPDSDPAGWASFAPWTRRSGEKAPGKILVDDSKLVHSGKYGFARLEHVVAAFLGLPGAAPGATPPAALAKPRKKPVAAAVPTSTWIEVLNRVAVPGVADDLRGEAWFDPALPLPLFADAPFDHRPLLRQAGLDVVVVGLNLVPTPVFNRVVAGSNSKATVLAAGLVALLSRVPDALPVDGVPVTLLCDKQSGRARYKHLIEAAFPTATVETGLESFRESRYHIIGLGRDCEARVVPEADSTSIAVALASCVAKYAREVSMLAFNAHWAGLVPGLKPTAGYPLDAKRFLADIRPTMQARGIADDTVWRVK